MTKQQKEEITKNVLMVNDMDYRKLCLFTQELYLAKPDMDKIVFKYTLRACDLCVANHREISSVSPMAVLSDMPQLD